MYHKSKQQKKVWLFNIGSRILSPIIVLVILIARARFPTILTDSVTLALLIMALLPWLAIFLDSAEWFGSKFKFRELEKRQEQQESQIRTLQFLLKHFVSQDELRHLEKLASDDQVFLFTQNSAAKFFEYELTHLRAMRLIENKTDMYLHTLMGQQQANVKDYFRIRPEGKEYLALSHEFQEQLRASRSKDQDGNEKRSE